MLEKLHFSMLDIHILHSNIGRHFMYIFGLNISVGKICLIAHQRTSKKKLFYSIFISKVRMHYQHTNGFLLQILFFYTVFGLKHYFFFFLGLVNITLSSESEKSAFFVVISRESFVEEKKEHIYIFYFYLKEKQTNN